MDSPRLRRSSNPSFSQRGTRRRIYGSENRRGRQQLSSSMRVPHYWENTVNGGKQLQSSSVKMGGSGAIGQIETAEALNADWIATSRGSLPLALKESIPRYKYSVGRGSMHVNLSSYHFPLPASAVDLIKYGKGRQSVGRPRVTRRGGPGSGKFGFVAQSRIDRSLEKRRLLHPKKGLLPPEWLYDSISREYPEIDGQCIIRFPYAVAEILRNRQALNAPLGLTISMTPQHEYRLFNISVEGYPKPLSGILVELPNIVESYKTIDGDLMFKSGDIAQMIYVYESSSKEVDIKALRDLYHWEWKSGLTPGTHRIRTRKFKNFNVFDQEDIRNAELEVLELLHGLTRDSYDYVAQTEYDMVVNAEKFQTEESADRIISSYDNLDELLRESGYASDTSDSMFGLTHTSWSARLESIPASRLYGTTSRLGRPRRARGILGQRGAALSSWRHYPRDNYHAPVRSEMFSEHHPSDVTQIAAEDHYLKEDHLKDPRLAMKFDSPLANVENQLGEKRRKQLLKKLKRRKKEKRKRRDERKERSANEVSATLLPVGNYTTDVNQVFAHSQDIVEHQQAVSDDFKVFPEKMEFLNHNESSTQREFSDPAKEDVTYDNNFNLS